MSNINLGEKSEKENRNLAKYSPFIRENGTVNYEYGKDFEKWFNDRFNGRDLMMSFFNVVKSKTNKNKNSREFLYVQEDWLFSWEIGDTQHTINEYQNIKLFSQEQLEKIAVYIESINDWCKANNKKFYFFIAPAKYRIYDDKFPFYIRKVFPDDEGKIYQLIGYLRKHSNVKVIYPDKILKEHKKQGLLYWKTDSHWNEMGAYWGYRELVREISKDFNIKHSIVLNYKSIQEVGWEINEYNPPSGFYNNRGPFFLENIKNKYRLVLFMDSFSVSMLTYLGNTFRQVSAFWGNDRNGITDVHNQLGYIKQNADIVVFEIVERHIDLLPEYIFEAL
jgi:hypothetical protein